MIAGEAVDLHLRRRRTEAEVVERTARVLLEVEVHDVRSPGRGDQVIIVSRRLLNSEKNLSVYKRPYFLL